VLERLNPDITVITNTLTTLPETLDETYERIFLGIPNHSRFFVHQALKWIYSHRALCNNNISATILLQAVQRASPELALSGNGFADGVELLREYCGCLISLANESARDRFASYIESTQQISTVSFAHYTVWEFLESSRIRASPAEFFAVQAGSAKMEFAEMLMLNALDATRYDLQSHLNPDRWLLDENFTAYYIICSNILLQRWGADVCQLDDLRRLSFSLLDPTIPHFEELKRLAQWISNSNCDYKMRGLWRIYAQFWDITWRVEPNSSKVKTFFNLLITDDSCELGNRFLEDYGMEDIMNMHVDLEVNGSTRRVVFQGPVASFCGSFSEEIGLHRHRRFFWKVLRHSGENDCEEEGNHGEETGEVTNNE